MSEYAIEIGRSASRAPDYGTDEALAADLYKTNGWLQEVIAEYEELEPKLDNNVRWMATHDSSHPKYEQNAEVTEDRLMIARGLLDRMHTLRELGVGEIARMSQEGEKKNKALIDQFFSMADWVRVKRAEVAEKEGAPF